MNRPARKPNVRKPAPAADQSAAVATPAPKQPAKPQQPQAREMTDAQVCAGAIQLLNYAADAGAFANNPKLWGPKAQVLDRLAQMAMRRPKQKDGP